MKNYEVLAEISAWTSSAYRQGILLSGIIYLYDIYWDIMSPDPIDNLKILRSLCGPSALQNVLLTTTQPSNVNPAKGKSSENSLRYYSSWRALIPEGAAIKKFKGTRKSGLELIDQLTKKEPKPLLIQQQIVEENKVLEETDAGILVKVLYPERGNRR